MAARRLIRAFRPAALRFSNSHFLRPPESCCFDAQSLFRSTNAIAVQAWKPASLSVSGIRCFASGEPPAIVLGMPALSPTMTQGNVIQWKKKEGDKVSPGDVLCVIETDKATVDFESVEEGFLAKILVPGGTNNVSVGQTIGVMVEDSSDIGKVSSSDFAAPPAAKKEAQPSSKPSSTAQQANVKPPPASNLPPHIVLGMPALSPTMTQGNIVEWKKKERDKVSAGDVLCTIETDKATVDFESVEEGYLAKIASPSGSKNVPIGQTIGVMVENEEDIAKVAAADFSGQPPATKTEGKPQADASSKVSVMSKPPAAAGSKALSRVGPSVRRLLAESGLDASSINGTGPRGVVLKGDVLAAIKGGTKPGKPPKDAKSRPSPPTSLDFEDIPTSQIRRIIAKRLIESKFGIPHFYISADAILDSTLLLRKEMKEKHGAAVSVNDFVIRATALALRSVPEANAFWDEKAEEIVFHKTIDISIAVATDKGLITPIVKNADLKTLSAISTEVKALAERARTGKLKPEEFQGGTFSISNLGMFPVDRFCAIINPPQACILAVGKGEKVVVWEDCSESGGRPRTVTKMGMTLSADNRVFDTTIAGRLLEALSANLQDPERMLL
ncbi:dihydrolipoyllysine-residue acetyltransferase component 1 of pyruvate dehydrogenase complex, mitochondrial isoform X1 [Selaginella moellendorffii]|uniref:dihydrolipoyllysine-residue acetyltransferase component 1 of pyruvate dehydrogenase complex, mitochondrial isoform X1 n=1 Tax=Selaginella moellendorffii TaxID=88036 RepID=UPI000D1CEA3D|nr:dihydrolipoyllysine-residue acetyltransferase component 1 of pyruvate dehydrogenase complex, mitochondrial isoform X1 [Selaginella moellendorffii]|eukprot:XP_024537367.1 dihydrolipoyllysine-residue acetyltransferase component 1 of pyruvate dehydrogenase complex, mitochondrial isoform X1 [Selaginella moellendorffii]